MTQLSACSERESRSRPSDSRRRELRARTGWTRGLAQRHVGHQDAVNALCNYVIVEQRTEDAATCTDLPSMSHGLVGFQDCLITLAEALPEVLFMEALSELLAMFLPNLMVTLSCE